MVNNKYVIVDGANVAHEEVSASGDPRVSNIVSMRQALIDRGYSPLIIVDATLRHEIDDPEQLESLIDSGIIRQAPAGTDADYFILRTAERQKALVVSNDSFKSYRDEYSWISDRKVPFMIIKGQIELHVPDLPHQ